MQIIPFKARIGVLGAFHHIIFLETEDECHSSCKVACITQSSAGRTVQFGKKYGMDNRLSLID
jgi:hypothetical protein